VSEYDYQLISHQYVMQHIVVVERKHRALMYRVTVFRQKPLGPHLYQPIMVSQLMRFTAAGAARAGISAARANLAKEYRRGK
jgi:hypothetical protein